MKNKKINDFIEKIHNPRYVLSDYEIFILNEICLDFSNSYRPFHDFFNDIFYTSRKSFNKNQAFKDFFMIMCIFYGDYIGEKYEL